MKRYLVYHGKNPIGGINAMDYIDAIEKARRLYRHDASCPKSKVRVRMAKTGTLLGSLAMSNYSHEET